MVSGKRTTRSGEFAESIINTVREPLVVLDQDLRVVSASRSFYKVFKVKPEETVGQLIYDLGNKQWDIPKLRELLETILPQKTTFDDYEVEHVFSAIGRRIMLLNARQIQRGKGEERIILLAIEDITARKKIEAGLEKTRKKLAIIKEKADEASEFAESIINTVREPLVALDQDLRVVSASRSFYKVFKVKPEETVGQLIYDLGNKQWDIPKLRELLETILPERTTFDDYEVEHVFSTIGRRIMLLNARQIKREKGKKRVILLAIEDITTQKELEREILSLAYHDHLTGLPNRMLVIDRFNMAMSQADRNGMKVALMMLDLDKFKEVNDTLGHHVGDKLLQAVAKKMTEILRKGDTVGRFGGDEFVFVLSDQKNDQNGLRVAKKIIDVFRNAFVLEGHSLRITSSIGISLYPDHGADIDTILKKADSAMYQAKQAGRNQYSLYSQA
ncbi:sensor domain-containing diguanylate cyclase [Desulfovibrionaceae bacterium CB1MN]|uniref:diguanylate cyclase domain-containing protein n=1 Tax=Hydrosulfovibrio ferrireducens TaxID=2934181 RepID=UPI003ABB0FA0